MQESTLWYPYYEVLEPKRSGGNEVVRVIEDTGRKIILQHMLVITGDDDKSFVIKHWRQDWEYEPAKILAYSDRNSWAWEDVPERMRSEEHTSELQSLMRRSSAVFCLKKQKKHKTTTTVTIHYSNKR